MNEALYEKNSLYRCRMLLEGYNKKKKSIPQKNGPIQSLKTQKIQICKITGIVFFTLYMYIIYTYMYIYIFFYILNVTYATRDPRVTSTVPPPSECRAFCVNKSVLQAVVARPTVWPMDKWFHYCCHDTIVVFIFEIIVSLTKYIFYTFILFY